jgi:hypothetical protein
MNTAAVALIITAVVTAALPTPVAGLVAVLATRPGRSPDSLAEAMIQIE